MPAREVPSYSSSRIQRAYRINNIEQSRLAGKLQLLDRQKVHQIRLTNQDIRLISLSLDYIQSSSGHSPEGLSPIKEDSDREDLNDSPEEKGPCFLYGERIVSRRVRRFRRPQSATDKSRTESVTSSSDTASLLTPRPKSSPSKSRQSVLWMTALLDDDDDDDDYAVSQKTRSRSPSPVHSWENETDEITRTIIQSQSQKRRTSVWERDPLEIRKMSVPALKPFPNGADDSQRPAPPVRRASTVPSSGRHSNISDILNQRRPTLSAEAWKNHLSKKRPMPLSLENQREKVMNEKLERNENLKDYVDGKVKSFIDSYPTRRSSVESM
ncbi:uncharacterized protein LOC121372229 [Gigantopelta aegis]|uniref:uncharacterized protein LOC121372229 n=1 Tax=Gigantopelta aegis TaxID=1735272 RepID=UPI001B889C0A|nr:uncharacterized protein LOC121372229 [Gigantopelta aegis]XP_041354454.1 uncharacterized protein LOC121372229 [Gigantopelta aegis]